VTTALAPSSRPAACGSVVAGPGDDDAKLDLKSGGEASLTVMGENDTCTYQRNGSTLTLTCPNQGSLEFTVHEDGSLTSVGHRVADEVPVAGFARMAA